MALRNLYDRMYFKIIVGKPHYEASKQFGGDANHICVLVKRFVHVGGWQLNSNDYSDSINFTNSWV